MHLFQHGMAQPALAFQEAHAADEARFNPFRRSEAAQTARCSGLNSDGRIGKAAITQSRVIAFRVEHADRLRALTVRLRLEGIAGNLDGGGLRRRGAVRHQERHGHDCKDLLHMNASGSPLSRLLNDHL